MAPDDASNPEDEYLVEEHDLGEIPSSSLSALFADWQGEEGGDLIDLSEEDQEVIEPSFGTLANEGARPPAVENVFGVTGIDPDDDPKEDHVETHGAGGLFKRLTSARAADTNVADADDAQQHHDDPPKQDAPDKRRLSLRERLQLAAHKDAGQTPAAEEATEAPATETPERRLRSLLRRDRVELPQEPAIFGGKSDPEDESKPEPEPEPAPEQPSEPVPAPAAPEFEPLPEITIAAESGGEDEAKPKKTPDFPELGGFGAEPPDLPPVSFDDYGSDEDDGDGDDDGNEAPDPLSERIKRARAASEAADEQAESPVFEDPDELISDEAPDDGFLAKAKSRIRFAIRLARRERAQEAAATDAGVDLSPPAKGPLGRIGAKVRGSTVTEIKSEQAPASEFEKLLTPLTGAEVALLQHEVRSDDTIFSRIDRARQAASFRHRLGLLIGVGVMIIYLLIIGQDYLTDVLPNAYQPDWIPADLRGDIAGAVLFALGLAIPFLCVVVISEAARLLLSAAADRNWIDAVVGTVAGACSMLALSALASGRVTTALLLLIVYAIVARASYPLRPELKERRKSRNRRKGKR